jgi:long-chain acyl-CoA synthetase
VGNLLPSEEIGEVIIKCPSNMIGYWGKPEETTAVLRDGWVYTADLGRKNEEGYLFLVGRKKDMIISGGFNIYAREVEEVILSHPEVAQAFVLGIPDERWGKSVKALVQLKPNSSIEPRDIIAFCRENLAHYKAPKVVEFVDNLPPEKQELWRATNPA